MFSTLIWKWLHQDFALLLWFLLDLPIAVGLFVSQIKGGSQMGTQTPGRTCDATSAVHNKQRIDLEVKAVTGEQR